MAMLKKGDKIPAISLKNDEGAWVDLSQHLGKDNLVVYFYPKNNTPGCTAEACEFRDHFDDFAEAGFIIYGISGDSENSHQQFKRRYKLNFNLLSDGHRKAEKAFGVSRNLFGLLPGRVTFVINKEGIIEHVFDSALNPKKHIHEALKKVQKSRN